MIFGLREVLGGMYQFIDRMDGPPLFAKSTMARHRETHRILWILSSETDR